MVLELRVQNGPDSTYKCLGSVRLLEQTTHRTKWEIDGRIRR